MCLLVLSVVTKYKLVYIRFITTQPELADCLVPMVTISSSLNWKSLVCRMDITAILLLFLVLITVFVRIKMLLITIIIVTSRYDDYNFYMINVIMINMT